MEEVGKSACESTKDRNVTGYALPKEKDKSHK